MNLGLTMCGGGGDAWWLSMRMDEAWESACVTSLSFPQNTLRELDPFAPAVFLLCLSLWMDQGHGHLRRDISSSGFLELRESQPAISIYFYALKCSGGFFFAERV